MEGFLNGKGAFAVWYLHYSIFTSDFLICRYETIWEYHKGFGRIRKDYDVVDLNYVVVA